MRMKRQQLPVGFSQFLLAHSGSRSLSMTYLRNLMASRSFAIIEILSRLQLPWILEQPSSSLMQEHPLFRQMATTQTIYRVAWLLLNPEPPNFIKRVNFLSKWSITRIMPIVPRIVETKSAFDLQGGGFRWPQQLALPSTRFAFRVGPSFG